ncbi:MAG: D-alanyl-D-alanine carboxypeptidase/D-alanyl-D-alanine-endopeptidase [Rhodocyclaceae bacterium]|nr:D-alanyl-D-alanine carboxypeptidase/D-alanyl-D-alanine-endopeptidase [Rhodocyclaceae bacterium]
MRILDQISRWGALLLTCWVSAALAALPVEVATFLARADIPRDAVALVVQPVEGGQPLVSHRAEAPMNPASVMKLLITLAALETLGPHRTFRTEVLANQPIEAGILAGDLYLRGSGDPKLTHERLWSLVRTLRAKGLVEIRGALVLDDAAYAPAPHDPAAFDGKPHRPYNVGPSGLLFNFGVTTLTLIPRNGDVGVWAEPFPAGWQIDNRVRSTHGPCADDWRERLSAVFEAPRLRLEGEYPRACGERQWMLAGFAHDVLLAGVFQRYWQEAGGALSGSGRRGKTPAEAIVLAASESPPLAELVRDINKFSNNVMAEQIFLALGEGKPEAAHGAIAAWLARKGLEFPELVLENGSGLSRRQRISAQSLARLLQYGWQSPLMPEFLASLPLLGLDGTVRNRFANHLARGYARLKTGSLDGVRAIAGYVQDRRGQRWIVVFLVNHEKAAASQPALDRLLEWVWSGAF